MDKTCSYEICTGCGGCEAICPKQCISFQTASDGHIYPHINADVCIDCGLCRKVCPPLIDNGLYPAAKALAAVIDDPEQYQASTSGGAAMAISRLTLTDGGVVYGCASLPGADIRHIRVTCVEDLAKLQGSKYVRSDLYEIFRPLRQDVRAFLPVTFIGTPCQCATIKALFRNRPDNLLLVDLVCHGIPSLKFLHDDLTRHRCDLHMVDRISFRDGNIFRLKVEHIGKEDTDILYHSPDTYGNGIRDIYYDSFLKGYSFRNSCYVCPFARPERCSDMTIGDFWGYGRKKPLPKLIDHPHGLSLILPITPKGHAMAHRLGTLMNLCERPVDEAIEGNSQLMHPFRKRPEIKVFRHLAATIGPFRAYTIITAAKKLYMNLKSKRHNGR